MIVEAGASAAKASKLAGVTLQRRILSMFQTFRVTGDLPGALVASRLENPYTGSNDFVITLPEPVTLSEGHYWVSVQARQDITQAGFGCGIIALSNRTLALPGKTPATVSAPAASFGFARLPVLR